MAGEDFPDYSHVLFVMPFALVVISGMTYRLRARVFAVEATWARVGLRVAGTALAAVVAVKAWDNARFLWRENPVVFDTAFGAVAGGAAQAAAYEAVRKRVPPDGGAPPRLFAYPVDAWLYLVLPADNPTPFSLLRPGYNTNDQVLAAIRLIEVDARVKVLVNRLYVKAGDPVHAFLTRRFRNEGPVGPWYQLFSQHPGYVPQREPGPG